MGEKNAKVDISAADARQFLEKLATDDSFRDKVAGNPKHELKQANIDVSGDIPNNVTLPSKQKIQKFIDDEVDTVPDATTGAVLGWAVLYVVLGAMPIVARGEPAGDAAG
jgi:putative modified peptide